MGNRGFKRGLVHLIPVEWLWPIEGHDRIHQQELQEKILAEGVWDTPIVVERERWLVLDGMHRFESALRLGLGLIPAVLVSYDEDPISVHCKQTGHELFIANILHNARMGSQYPKHTCVHTLPEGVREATCHHPLWTLMNVSAMKRISP